MMSPSHDVKRILGAIVLIIMFAFNAPVNAQTYVINVNLDRDVIEGQDAFSKGDLDAALEHFERAVEKDLSPEHHVIVQNYVCAVSYMQGNYDAATEACTKVIDEDSGYWKAYVTRGNAKRALGDFTGALIDFCTANRLNPADVKGNFEARCVG